ncbi:MAG: CRISPR-associated endonuclease Cas1 [Gammaproteobacteria bacterium]
MRPLYLKGSETMRVEYDEPALAVEEPGKARQLFPLSRLSRVLVSGNVEWSMPALMACADAGVPVVFSRATGEIRGLWLSRRVFASNWLQHFYDALQQDDVRERYRDWLAGMQRMAARSAARRLGSPNWHETDADVLKDWFERTQPKAWRSVNGWFEALLTSTVLQTLGPWGLDAGSDCWQDRDFHLPEDFCRLLFTDFYPALIGWHERSPEVPEYRAVIAFYEQRLPRTEALLRQIINKWHRWLLALY